ncbi:MAG: hypothetical protein CMF04_09400 [Hyphomonas sp.]|nr:hypothetical protein [Hyphomonas sp.]
MDKTRQSSDFPAHAIAIVGMAGRFPDAPDLDSFWRNIVEGHESLRTFDAETMAAAGIPPELQANPDFVPKGTVLDDTDKFDADFFGVSAGEARIIDPQQRIFLECAWEALEHAGYAPGQIEDPVGVYAGTGMNTYLMAHILSDRSVAETAGGYQLMLGNDKDFLCTRVSYKLDLRGPSATVQTACSTSLVAVEMACRALSRGECDMALAGGVSINFPSSTGYLYQEGMIFSPDGHCRPFDEAAKGTRAGAGAGVVTLKRLDDAMRDGDTIHAVIRGIAVNNDGAAKAGYTAPSIDGQAEVIAMAQTLADVDPRTIGYMEAHGTATPLGDPIEIAALTQVFRYETDDVGFCRLGSLKANIGHLDAAAVVAGLIKAALVLREGVIPPLVNYSRPNPKLELEASPFAASADATKWTGNGAPRRAAVSSFGIGGTNVHAVLEQAPTPAPAIASRKHQLLVLSARTKEALTAASSRLADHIGKNTSQSLADTAWTLQTGRTEFPVRRFVIAGDGEEAMVALSRSFTPRRHEGGTRQVAFLFSGQGSQYAGMGHDLYAGEPVYRAAIDQCAGILKSSMGLDLCKVLFEGSDEDLAKTSVTQPALFATEYAMAKLWQSWGVEPAAMMGHSIGEYVAAHLAGVMTLEEALLLVAERGRLMHAMPAGSMATVQLSGDRVRARLPDGVEIAAINAPELTAISGPASTVEAFLTRLESEGVGVRRLHTSHAFHSSMMEPALEPFRAAAAQVNLKEPQVPYISNVTGTWITPEQAVSPDYYAQHLRQAVLFEQGLQELARNPGLFLLEVGPGIALSSLAGISLDSAQYRIASSMRHPRDSQHDMIPALNAVGSIWAAGVPIDWAALHGETSSVHRVPLPTYPFERTRHWVDPKPGGGFMQAPVAQVTDPLVEVFSPEAGLGQFLQAPTWTQVPANTMQAPVFSGKWVVLADNSAFGEALTSGLEKGGAEALLGTPSGTDAGDAADSIRTLNALIDEANGALSGVIIALGLEEGANIPGRLRYDVLSALARHPEIATERPVRVVLATRGGLPVLEETVTDPEVALAFGAISVLAAETTHLMPQHVDFADDGKATSQTNARRLLAEVGREKFELQLAWRKRRWLRRFEPIELPRAEKTPDILKQKGVYLITGGLGGIGRTLARQLAKNVSARIVVTTRNAVPPRDAWDDLLAAASDRDRTASVIKTVREIESLGGEIRIEQADVVDREAMQGVVDRTREAWGEISGIIHAAGVPGSGNLLALETEQEVTETFAPKVDGLRVLVDVLGDTELDFVALMSSINAVRGVAGNAAYSSANAFLDTFVASNERPAAWNNVLIFNWEAWRDVGMASRIDRSRMNPDERDLLYRISIPPDVGADIFERVLASDVDQLVVSNYNLAIVLMHERAELILRANGADTSQANAGRAASSAAPADVSASIAARFGREEEQQIAMIWEELLGGEMEGPHENFFERGGHSLMATRVLSRLNAVTGVKLTLRDIFDSPTIGELADCVVSHRDDSQDDQDDDREEFVI